MILVVQFRQDVTEEHERECILARSAQPEEVRFVSVFDERIDFSRPEELLRGYDKLILGGSAGLSMAPGHESNDYEKIEFILETIAPLVNYVLEYDFPTLGTCFGHQLLGHFAGGSVTYDPDRSETGAFELTLTEEGLRDPFFKDVPAVFSAIEGHQDTIITKPENATILASSQRAEIQALRYGNNVYGTQFHSELDGEDLMYRLSLFPEYTRHASKESLDIPPCPYGVYVLRNFLESKVAVVS